MFSLKLLLLCTQDQGKTGCQEKREGKLKAGGG